MFFGSPPDVEPVCFYTNLPRRFGVEQIRREIFTKRKNGENGWHYYHCPRCGAFHVTQSNVVGVFDSIARLFRII